MTTIKLRCLSTLIICCCNLVTLLPAAYSQSAPRSDKPDETKPTASNPTERQTEIDCEPWKISDQLLRSFTVGGLDFRGGLILSRKPSNGKSNDFGGFSGLSVSANGQKLSIVSDRGRWAVIDVELDAADSLQSATTKTREGSLKLMDDKLSPESIATSPIFGYLVSFDNSSQVHRYRHDLNSQPTLMVPRISINNFQVSDDDAFEAFAANANGMYLISEKIPSATSAGNRAFYVPFASVNRPVEFVFQTVQMRETSTRSVHLQPSGATFLSDGSLLVLSRHFFRRKASPHYREVAVAISRIPASKLTAVVLNASPVVSGELLYLNSSREFDNFEGVSSFLRNGKEFIYLLSDDNQSRNGAQQTILALFEVRAALAREQELLTSGSATQHVAVRCFEIAKDNRVDEESRVAAIQQLTSATIPPTDLIGKKQVHVALIDLLNQPNTSYEIQYQTARALIKRYALKNNSGQGGRQSAIIDGLATFAKRTTTPARLRKYILNHLVQLAEKKSGGGM